MNPNMVILLDHANIPFSTVSVLDIVAAWANALLQERRLEGILSVGLRAYGGWYIGERNAPARAEAAEFYSQQTPVVFRYRGGYIRLSFEFADYLAVSPAGSDSAGRIQISHTYVRRESAQSVSFISGSKTCTEDGCELKLVRTWIRKRRACTKPACPQRFSDFFERTEQKQVDIHIASDLIFYALKGYEVAVASDDSDLLPAYATAAMNKAASAGITVIRFLTSQTYLDSLLEAQGVKIRRAAAGGLPHD